MQKTDVRAQKISKSILKIYDMVIVDFQVQDKLEKARFFQKTFLVADTSVKVIFEMFFLTLSKIKVDFTERKLTWKAYITTKALPTTKKV